MDNGFENYKNIGGDLFNSYDEILLHHIYDKLYEIVFDSDRHEFPEDYLFIEVSCRLKKLGLYCLGLSSIISSVMNYFSLAYGIYDLPAEEYIDDVQLIIYNTLSEYVDVPSMFTDELLILIMGYFKNSSGVETFAVSKAISSLSEFQFLDPVIIYAVVDKVFDYYVDRGLIKS